MAIGNELELLEAITLMRNDFSNPLWDKRALKEQKDLIITMLAIMLKKIFPDLLKNTLRKEISNLFSTKAILHSFKELLSSHKVKMEDVNQIVENPNILIKDYDNFIVKSKQGGILTYLNQKALGAFVNFELSTGLNQYIEAKHNGAGIILKVRLGDKAKKGQSLCIIIAKLEYLKLNQTHIEKFVFESLVLKNS
ncbi:MAG: hypothetical protein ACRYE9_04525 [Janthinobacterium lividum]